MDAARARLREYSLPRPVHRQFPTRPGLLMSVPCSSASCRLPSRFQASKYFASPLRWTIVGLYCALIALPALLPASRPATATNWRRMPSSSPSTSAAAFISSSLTGAPRREHSSPSPVSLPGPLYFVVGPPCMRHLPASPCRKRSMEPAQVPGRRGHDPAASGRPDRAQRHLALHDHLTGLPNRRLYQDRLANALERARRSNAHAALLVIDLDPFKQVNDTLGHHVGDLVLQRVAALCSPRVFAAPIP